MCHILKKLGLLSAHSLLVTAHKDLNYTLFLVLSHMFGYTWNKNYWADCEKVRFFFNLIFMSVRILSFNAIHSVIKKITNVWGLSEMAYFIFGYLSTKLGTSVDGHEKIIT
jgi:hypothetical protein